MGGQFAAATDTGRRRDRNEDEAIAQLLADGSVLLAVADGAGGMGGGDVASKASIAALSEGVADAGSPVVGLRTGFERANNRVRAAAAESTHPTMASTLVAAIVRGDRAWVASIGDSRAYLWRDGQLERLTEDDSLVAEQVRAGTMTEEQARLSPQRNIITRAIGGEDATVEPTEVELRAGDQLLLCSDGLHGVVEEQEIAELLASGTVEDTVARLIEAANKGGGPDNIGIALFRMSGDEPPGR